MADFLPLKIKNVGLCSNLAQGCLFLIKIILVAAKRVPLLDSNQEQTEVKYVVNLDQVSSEV